MCLLHYICLPDILGDRLSIMEAEEEEEEELVVKYTEVDRKHMRRALELAAKALGN